MLLLHYFNQNDHRCVTKHYKMEEGDIVSWKVIAFHYNYNDIV